MTKKTQELLSSPILVLPPREATPLHSTRRSCGYTLPDEAPIRPVKPDPWLLMEPVKYHRFKNPCVINTPGSPASTQIIPFRNTPVQYSITLSILSIGCSIRLTLMRLFMRKLEDVTKEWTFSLFTPHFLGLFFFLSSNFNQR